MNSKIVIPIALISIGAGMYGVSQDYLAKQQAPTTRPLQPVIEETVNTTMVWAAKVPLGAKQSLDSKSFELKAVPENEAIARGVDPSSPINIEDSWLLKKDIDEGHWLTSRDYITPDDENYIEFAIGENRVPYPLAVDATTIVGGVVDDGSSIDIIAITRQKHRLNPNEGASSFESINIHPVLVAIKVLKVEEDKELMREESKVSLVLELTRDQVARLSIAKSIATLEVHKSVGAEQAALLQANSGDVLPEYRAIVEYRAGSVAIR